MIDPETQAGFDLIPDHPMVAIEPCQMTRELRLKLCLARLLPDEIEVTDLYNFKWKCGALAGERLRDTEWDYVVRKIYVVIGTHRSLYYPQHWRRLAEDLFIQRGIKWDT